MWLMAWLAAAHATAVWVEGEDFATSTFNEHGWYGDANADLLSPGTPGGTEGAWHVHYASGSAPAEASWSFTLPAEGQWVLWIRTASYRVAATVSVDGGDAVDLDLDHTARETLNVVQPALDVRFLSWTRVGALDLGAGEHTLTYAVGPHPDWGGSQLYGGVDAFVLVDDGRAPSGAALAPPVDEDGEAGSWFGFFPGDPPADWSVSVYDPAWGGEDAGWGEPVTGRIRADGARLVDATGEEVVLWGLNSRPPGTEALMRQQAALYAGLGINLVRVHPLQDVVGDPVDPTSLDRYDQWFAILAEHGISTQWSVFYPHVIDASDGYPALGELSGGSTSGLVTVFEDLQTLEWDYLAPLLAHENAYTGRSYATDPALAVVEQRNEDSIFWHWPLNPLAAGELPQHLAWLQADWRAWLEDRYGTDAALAAAWGAGTRSTDSLSNDTMGIYGAWEMAADGPAMDPAEAARMGDWIRFLAERQREGYDRRIEALRGAGYEGLVITTAWQAGGPAAHLANQWTDAAGDVVDRHFYWGGGAGGHGIAAGAVSNDALLADPSHGLLTDHTPLLADKPLIHSEWNSNPPNQWRAEALPLYGIYGMGAHGWDGCIHFSGSSRAWIDGGWPGLGSYVSETPLYLGQSFPLAKALRRGLLEEAAPGAVVRLSEDQLFTGLDEVPDLDAWAAAVGPILLEMGEGEHELPDPADALVDGRYATSSGPSWSPAGHLVVDEPRFAAVVGHGVSGTHALQAATLTLESAFASVMLVAMPGGAWLVTALARDLQTGASYSAGGTNLDAVGGPPLLLEPVLATLDFEDGVRSVTALDVYGVPRRDLPEAVGAGGTVTLDGRWRTAWYLVQLDVEPEDTAAPQETDDTDTSGSGGCGCGGGSASAALLLPLLLAGRRRRYPGPADRWWTSRAHRRVHPPFETPRTQRPRSGRRGTG